MHVVHGGRCVAAHDTARERLGYRIHCEPLVVSLPTTLLESDSDTASIVSRSFNAWGPDGGLQRRFADSAASSSSVAGSSGAAASVAEEDPNVVGDWSRVRAPRWLAVQNGNAGLGIAWRRLLEWVLDECAMAAENHKEEDIISGCDGQAAVDNSLALEEVDGLSADPHIEEDIGKCDGQAAVNDSSLIGEWRHRTLALVAVAHTASKVTPAGTRPAQQ
ncbi:hypothetical protein G3M48_001640 [Beauveria asiatica]|uniref:Uncharacterized protein n=1 Tax=Beauveria asiatica TaxID=1069075 RepID=A0AAW0RFA6_9HYPO